jgi:hypothetical protein
VKGDREKFRDYLAHKLKWLVEIHGKGKHPETGWLIQDIAKMFSYVERWYW